MGWEEDGTTKILFGVIGLIRWGDAFDRQGDVFLPKTECRQGESSRRCRLWNRQPVDIRFLSGGSLLLGPLVE